MVAKVLEILQSAGYRIMPQPLKIVDVDFQSDFPAILSGPHEQHSLVVVIDATRTPLPLAKRRIKALTTTLDRSGAEIPLTVVLITTDSELEATQGFDTICRVVRVSNISDPATDLRVLLPLALPEPTEPLPSAIPTLLASLGTGAQDDLERSLVKAARSGQSAVSEAVRKSIDRVAREYLSHGGVDD